MCDVVSAILSLGGFELTDRARVEEAVRLARATGQDFADAYIAASVTAAQSGELATFNRKPFTQLGTPLHSL